MPTSQIEHHGAVTSLLTLADIGYRLLHEEGVELSLSLNWLGKDSNNVLHRKRFVDFEKRLSELTEEGGLESACHATLVRDVHDLCGIDKDATCATCFGVLHDALYKQREHLPRVLDEQSPKIFTGVPTEDDVAFALAVIRGNIAVQKGRAQQSYILCIRQILEKEAKDTRRGEDARELIWMVWRSLDELAVDAAKALRGSDFDFGRYHMAWHVVITQLQSELPGEELGEVVRSLRENNAQTPVQLEVEKHMQKALENLRSEPISKLYVTDAEALWRSGHEPLRAYVGLNGKWVRNLWCLEGRLGTLKFVLKSSAKAAMKKGYVLVVEPAEETDGVVHSLWEAGEGTWEAREVSEAVNGQDARLDF